MNIQRFTATTSREALAKARMAFGDGTLILSNRPTDSGVEVVATAEDTLAQLGSHATTWNPQANKARSADDTQNFQEVESKVEDDAAQLAMSTLSFQDYVRERMLRKRHASIQSATPEPEVRESSRERPRTNATEKPATKSPSPTLAAPVAVASSRKPAPSSAAHPSMPPAIAEELQAMKALMEDRFNTLTWLGQARQNPLQANLMLKMIRAGYSPTLSRAILERMPDALHATEAVRWVMDVLERNLHTDDQKPTLHEEGGTFALVGATGVGKTTSAAKLAGLCARAYGAASVGLITLDTYRVGAHEQLRAYGKLLGVVAHLAHDRAALHDLLGLLANKKMVLVDTTGLAPRDPRKREMMDLLNVPGIKRLLVLNAGGHGDTLDDVVSAFKQDSAQEVIFSKIDEAVKLGPAIDAAIRHQLVLRGVTTGQRVPEDWESAVAAKLVHQSMRSSGGSAFDPKVGDLGFFFGQVPMQSSAVEHVHV